MALLILGLSLFLGIHLVPVLGVPRERLQATLGSNGYRGLFSLISALGLGLIGYGKAVAPFVPVWSGWGPGFHLSLAVMPVVFILLASANMPGHIRARLRHPMLIGVLLWSGIHLSVNGDVASMLLFGSFFVWAAIDLVSATMRGKTLLGTKPPSWRFDLIAVLAGSALFFLVARFHAQLFGPAVLP